jgi:hypothetical protein
VYSFGVNSRTEIIRRLRYPFSRKWAAKLWGPLCRIPRLHNSGRCPALVAASLWTPTPGAPAESAPRHELFAHDAASLYRLKILGLDSLETGRQCLSSGSGVVGLGRRIRGFRWRHRWDAAEVERRRLPGRNPFAYA